MQWFTGKPKKRENVHALPENPDNRPMYYGNKFAPNKETYADSKVEKHKTKRDDRKFEKQYRDKIAYDRNSTADLK